MYVTRMGKSNLTNETMRVESTKRHESSVLGDCVYNCVCGSVIKLRVCIMPHLHNGEMP